MTVTDPRLAVLYVSDADRALAFLTSAFGLAPTVDSRDEEGRRWVEARVPGGQVGVALAQIDAGLLARLRVAAGRMTHGWFDCDDVDATCAGLRARGVEITVPPEPTPWRAGGRWAQITDPDGNRYGLTEPADRSQERP